MARNHQIWDCVRDYLTQNPEATYTELLDWLKTHGVRLSYRALQCKAKRWERKGWIGIERRGAPPTAYLALPEKRANRPDMLAQKSSNSLAMRVARKWGVSVRTMYRAFRFSKTMLQIQAHYPDACTVIHTHREQLRGVVNLLPLIPMRLIPFVAKRVAAGETSLTRIVRELLHDETLRSQLTAEERMRLCKGVGRRRPSQAQEVYELARHLSALSEALEKICAIGSQTDNRELLHYAQKAQYDLTCIIEKWV